MSKITSFKWLEWPSETISEFQFESGNVVYANVGDPDGRELHDMLLRAYFKGDEVGFLSKTDFDRNMEVIGAKIGAAFKDGVEQAGGTVSDLRVEKDESGDGVGFTLTANVQGAVGDDDGVASYHDGYDAGAQEATARLAALKDTIDFLKEQNAGHVRAFNQVVEARDLYVELNEARKADIHHYKGNIDNLIATREHLTTVVSDLSAGAAKLAAERNDATVNAENLHLEVDRLRQVVAELNTDNAKLADIVDNLRLPQTGEVKPLVIDMNVYEPGRAKGAIESVAVTSDETGHRTTEFEFVNGTVISVPEDQEGSAVLVARLKALADSGDTLGIVSLPKLLEATKQATKQAAGDCYDDGYEEGYQDANADSDDEDDINEYEAGHSDGVNEILDEMLAMLGAQLVDSALEPGDTYILDILTPAALDRVEQFVSSFRYLAARNFVVGPEVDLYAEFFNVPREAFREVNPLVPFVYQREEGKEVSGYRPDFIIVDEPKPFNVMQSEGEVEIVFDGWTPEVQAEFDKIVEEVLSMQLPDDHKPRLASGGTILPDKRHDIGFPQG